MTKTLYDLILKLQECDDRHNRCDYLMEHDEITYLLEYIEYLQEENKRYKKLGFKHLNEQNKDLQQRIDRAIEYIKNEGEHTDCCGEPIYYLDEEQEEELLEILGGKE